MSAFQGARSEAGYSSNSVLFTHSPSLPSLCLPQLVQCVYNPSTQETGPFVRPTKHLGATIHCEIAATPGEEGKKKRMGV